VQLITKKKARMRVEAANTHLHPKKRINKGGKGGRPRQKKKSRLGSESDNEQREGK